LAKLIRIGDDLTSGLRGRWEMNKFDVYRLDSATDLGLGKCTLCTETAAN